MSDTFTEFGPLSINAEEIAARGYGMASPRGPRPIVCFFKKCVPNPHKSELAGKPVFEEKIFFRHQFPGETLQTTEHEAKDSEKRQYIHEWQAFLNGKQGREQIPDGIPMDFLFPSSPSIVGTLEQHNIYTVEQLANLSGNAIQTVGMGCQEWVNKAAKYVEQAEKGVNFHKFETVIKEKDQRISTLERQVSEMQRQVDRFMHKVSSSPAQNFDIQSSQIAAMKAQETFSPPPVEFSADITPKRRGRPPGSRNKPKE